MTKARILVLVCGGTILMGNAAGGGLSMFDQARSQSVMAGLLEQQADDWELTVRHVFSMDSTDMEPADWEILGRIIFEEGGDFDAVLIVTGTNTMAYLSSALSFALHGISVPVLITGAQIPATAAYSDAKANLVNALRVSSLVRPGVYVIFGRKVLLGCRAKKASEIALDAFISFNVADVGTIGVEIRIQPEFRKRLDLQPGPCGAHVRFEPEIACVTILPGSSPGRIERVLLAGCRGLILRSFGSGDIPRSLFPALKGALNAKIPVVNTTQCAGSTMMGVNEVGKLALEYNVIQAFDMSMEAMSTKLMWLLGNAVPYEEIPRRMQLNVAGEIGERTSAQ